MAGDHLTRTCRPMARLECSRLVLNSNSMASRPSSRVILVILQCQGEWGQFLPRTLLGSLALEVPSVIRMTRTVYHLVLGLLGEALLLLAEDPLAEDLLVEYLLAVYILVALLTGICQGSGRGRVQITDPVAHPPRWTNRNSKKKQFVGTSQLAKFREWF